MEINAQRLLDESIVSRIYFIATKTEVVKS